MASQKIIVENKAPIPKMKCVIQLQIVDIKTKYNTANMVCSLFCQNNRSISTKITCHVQHNKLRFEVSIKYKQLKIETITKASIVNQIDSQPLAISLNAIGMLIMIEITAKGIHFVHMLMIEQIEQIYVIKMTGSFA